MRILTVASCLLAKRILASQQKLGACPGREKRKRREDYTTRIQAPPNTDVTSGQECRPANSEYKKTELVPWCQLEAPVKVTPS